MIKSQKLVLNLICKEKELKKFFINNWFDYYIMFPLTETFTFKFYHMISSK